MSTADLTEVDITVVKFNAVRNKEDRFCGWDILSEKMDATMDYIMYLNY